ncbi:MAG: hypothetical protein AAFY73_00480 [Pseudomonadota bacterium]
MGDQIKSAAVGTRPITWQHRLEAIAAQAVVAVLRLLPVEHASTLGGWLAEKILMRTRRGKRAERQIAAVMPDLSPTDCKRIAKASCNSFGRAMAELPHLPAIFADPDRITLRNDDILAAAKSRQSGTIYVAGHLGNWELLPGVASRADQNFHGFYRPLSNAILEDRLRKIRMAAAQKAILVPAASRGVADVISALRGGETAGLLVDLFEGNGLEGQFLGLSTRTNALAATLSIRCNAQIILVLVRRLPGVRFEIEFEEIETSRTGNREQDIALTTEAINRKLEAAILAKPEQWLWSTNRWKGQDLSTLPTEAPSA